MLWRSEHGRRERTGRRAFCTLVARQPEDPSSLSSTAVGWTRPWPRSGRWSGQRCTVQHRNLFAHAPDRLHEEVSADYNDLIYAQTRQEIRSRPNERPSSENGGSNAAPSPTAWRKQAPDRLLLPVSRKANGSQSEPRTPSNACTRNSSAGSIPELYCRVRRPRRCSSGHCWPRGRS